MTTEDLIPANAPRMATPVEVAGWLGVTRATVLKWSKTGVLPKRVIVSRKVTRFITDEVREAVTKMFARGKSA